MKKIVALVLSLAMVLAMATTAFAAVAEYDLYYGDEDTAMIENVTRAKVAAKSITETNATGQVAAWKLSWNAGAASDVFVQITAGEATNEDYYIAKAGDEDADAVMYLRLATNDGKYTLTGKALTNYSDPDADPVCGEWKLDGVTEKAYVDSEGDFYVTGTGKFMLVDNKIVEVQAANPATQMVGHEMEGVYDAKDKLVGVKCVVCGATGTVYASAAKAPMGATTYDFDTVVYVLDAVKAPAADEKVESAETFDAGIAMYVGMSVMAAAGSAVVLKKKD